MILSSNEWAKTTLKKRMGEGYPESRCGEEAAWTPAKLNRW